MKSSTATVCGDFTSRKTHPSSDDRPHRGRTARGPGGSRCMRARGGRTTEDTPPVVRSSHAAWVDSVSELRTEWGRDARDRAPARALFAMDDTSIRMVQAWLAKQRGVRLQTGKEWIIPGVNCMWKPLLCPIGVFVGVVGGIIASALLTIRKTNVRTSTDAVASVAVALN